MLDRLGNCPNCGAKWDGGDVMEQLSKLDTLTHVNEDEIKKLARSMGWTEENKTRFTKLMVKDYRDSIVLVCLNCGTGYSAVTGEKITINNQTEENGDTNQRKEAEQEEEEDVED
jgi:pyrrolidone-carboxylate peptidase